MKTTTRGGCRLHRGRLSRFLAVAAMAALAAGPARGNGPPAGTYATWLQGHFPGAFGNPQLEATVWGDLADPDGDGCGNLIEFMMARDPNVSDQHLGARHRIEGEDVVITYRETTATGHGVAWLGEWSVDAGFWVQAGVRYQTVDETNPDYRLVEARITRNRERKMLFRVAVRR